MTQKVIIKQEGITKRQLCLKNDAMANEKAAFCPQSHLESFAIHRGKAATEAREAISCRSH